MSAVEGFSFCVVFVGSEVVATDIAPDCPAFLAFSFIFFFVLVAPFEAGVSAMFSFVFGATFPVASLAITFPSNPSYFWQKKARKVKNRGSIES